MRRMMLLALCMLLFFSGCTEDTVQTPCSFYYLQRQISNTGADSVVAAQIADAGALTPKELLSRYLAGPSDPQLESPFPFGTRLIDFTHSGRYVGLIVSDELAALSGMELTLACVCMTKTCMEITQADIVEIRCQSQKLNGSESVTMTSDSFRLQDGFYPDISDTDNTQPQEGN